MPRVAAPFRSFGAFCPPARLDEVAKTSNAQADRQVIELGAGLIASSIR